MTAQSARVGKVMMIGPVYLAAPELRTRLLAEKCNCLSCCSTRSFSFAKRKRRCLFEHAPRVLAPCYEENVMFPSGSNLQWFNCLSPSFLESFFLRSLNPFFEPETNTKPAISTERRNLSNVRHTQTQMSCMSVLDCLIAQHVRLLRLSKYVTKNEARGCRYLGSPGFGQIRQRSNVIEVKVRNHNQIDRRVDVAARCNQFKIRIPLKLPMFEQLKIRNTFRRI